MKQERKFRFVGDPHEYMEPELDKNGVYLGGHLFSDWDRDVEWHADSFPEDWEEVTEQEEEVQIHNRVIHSKTETTRIPNKDQPASEMTKFEMAVLGNLKGLISNPNTAHQITAALGNNVDADTADKAVVSKAIKLAKETFKQLENLKK